ncbi:hypothetical protein ASC58_11790 [Phycicoccus sp. Root101]|nr:hypothetical protein ASC58_11790 [Phycicoccus sp. Root101]
MCQHDDTRSVCRATERPAVRGEGGATRKRRGPDTQEIVMRSQRHLDTAHHHPVVSKARGSWTWTCECGGAHCRTDLNRLSWRRVVVEALAHSTTIAA